MPHFRLIDGNAIGWRLHCAAAQEIHPELGIEVQGVRAFAGQLSNLAGGHDDCLNVVLWDGRAQWRYELYPEYKSGRHATEQQRAQRRLYEAARPHMQRWAKLAPVLQVTHPLMEADDLAFRASRALSAAGYSVELLTIDSDWQQLVDPRVTWRSIGKGAKRCTVETFEPDSVLLATAQVKALTGDTSDSIDGLPGVGDARALQLLCGYGGLDQLLAAAESLEGIQGYPKWANQLNLPEKQALVRRNRELVELARAPLFDLADAIVEVGEYDFLEALDLCMENGFHDWAGDFPAAIKGIERRLDEGRVRTFTRLVGVPG